MEQDKYTARTLAALQSAQQIAAMRYHQEITSAHVLLALAKEPEGLLATIFDVCGVDLPMLKAAGKSIAMGNAFPEVKEVTDYETLTCEENGLAAAIYHYVLGMGADAPVPMTRS